MNKIKSGFLALFCLVLCVFLLCSCSGGKADSFLLKAQLGSAEASSESKSFHTQNKDKSKLIKIARSDLITLYFDKATCSPAVYDSAGKTLWNSLCETDNNKACVLSVNAVFENVRYTFNSQDDSVALSKATYDISDSTVSVKYNFEKQTESGKTISFCVPVEFSVESGVLSVSSDMNALLSSRSDSSLVIEKISLLNYFGSSSSGKKGDFIFVPDGSGLVISTQNSAKEFKPLSIPVYSQNDLSNKNGFASIPVFALKKSDAAFVGIIESGSEIASITANKALKNGELNRVGTEFEITQTAQNEKGQTLFSNKSYDGKISLSYRFLSGENADYPSMAASCRESFVRSGLLSMSDEVEASSAQPFIINLIGSAQLQNGKVKTLTTFEQAQEMLTFFRNKGFSDITVNYDGVFRGGLRQNSLENSSLSKSLGSKADFENLIAYANAQNVKINLGANLLSAKSLGKNSALALGGEVCQTSFADIPKSSEKTSNSAEFASARQIESAANSLIKLSEKYSFNGICLLDGAKYLYGDFSKSSFAPKAQIKETISSQCAALSSAGNVITDGANIYVLKYSSLILNMPQSAKNESRDYCTAVPFLQIVFHGVKPYTLQSSNLCKNAETQILKCVEYGAMLSCDAYYEDLSKDGQSDPMNYLSFGSKLQGYYDRVSSLSSLSSMKITDHYKVKDGVYCTEFENSATVYVNYNKKDAKVGGATVEARSFILLK